MFSVIKNLGGRAIALLIINDERVEPKTAYREPIDRDRHLVERAKRRFDAKKRGEVYAGQR